MRTDGWVRVTRASLQIKDRTTIPPDRVLFTYHVRLPNGTIELVEGSWGDYLRDLDALLVVKQRAPLNNSENPENAMLITDLYAGIPDRTFIPDPTLPL